MNRSSKIVKPHPFEYENWLNKLFIWWLIPIFKIGWNRSLELSDLFCHPKVDEPSDLTDDLVIKWEKEKTECKLKNKSPSIAVATFKSVAPTFFTYVWWMVIYDGGIRALQPLLIGYIVRYLSNPVPELATLAQVSIATLIITTAIGTLMVHHGFAKHVRIGNNMRSALSNMIYQKLLRLSKSSAEGQDMGNILNMLANDLNRFEELGWLTSFYISGPLCAIIVFIITYSYIGYSTFAGFTLVILFIPFQSFMGRLFTRFRSATIEASDKRVNLMGEILSAMKLIKVYCWEKPFIDSIRDIREDEITKLKRTVYLDGVNVCLFSTAPRFFLFISLMCFVVTGGQLNAEMVFVCMSAYNSMKVPVTGCFPEAVAITAEALVSFGRINKFLLMEEKPDKELVHRMDREGSIQFNDYVAKWSQDAKNISLNGISFSLKPGELLIVVGSVGSGKTCLLYSLLNEIHHVSGKCMVNGSLSYAPQDTWCIGDTLKNNILMGDPIDSMKYKQVIDVCGLKRDIEQFELRDDHFVGEKGYTLSGGQKARVSLARCVYKQSDIYLLDDPLSAVDPKVANHIFNDCIKGYLNGKTVVLVTHQLQFLEKADQIAVLKDGKLTSFGKYNDLANNDPEFNSILKKLKTEEKRKNSDTKHRGLSILTPKKEGDSIEEEPMKSIPLDQDQLDQLDMKRQEKKESGAISAAVYWNYLRFGGSVLFLLMVLIISIIAEGVCYFSDVWLASWTETEFTNSSIKPSMAHDTIFETDEQNIMVYGSLMVLMFLTTFIRIYLVSLLCIMSSINMHNMIFGKILRANMSFFETNPLGRILNRFTRDMSIIDTVVFRTIVDLNFCGLDIIGTIALAAIINYYLVLPALILALISYPIRELYIRSTRDMKRLESITGSPLMSQLTTTYDGLITVRAFKLEKAFHQTYISYLKDAVSTKVCVYYAVRWFGNVMDFLANFYILCIAIVLFSAPKGMIPAADAGLVLSTSLLLMGLFQYFMRMTATLETQMTSAERIMEYGKLPQEAAFRVETKDSNWLTGGQIQFTDVSLKYNPESPHVLKNITFTIHAGEKVGVVGRTGAGKSSLICVLFRLVEPEGRITIDGVNIQSIGLHDLREKISIIPQDPSLFSGSVRRNLDPFDEYDDYKMWGALTQAHMGETIKNMGGLDAKVTEGGSNLSIGQRQLLCLARSLLKQNRILVMDEATANVDQETDELIQKTIKNTFKDYTVLTVAHRLNTIIDMDKVLVMDSGKVVELDHPHKLLQDEHGTFHSMVKQTGPEFEKMLHLLAEKSYYSHGSQIYID